MLIQNVYSPLDVDSSSTAAFHLQTLATRSPFSPLLRENGPCYEPGFDPIDPANVSEHVKKRSNTIYHAIGTRAVELEGAGDVVYPKIFSILLLQIIESAYPLSPHPAAS